MINLIKLQIRYTARFTTITLAPGGVFSIKDMKKPSAKHKSAITEEKTVTFLKLFERHIAESGGKIIRPVISIVPIILIPNEITSAHKRAIIVLNKLTFVPVAFAKSSSNVTEKI